MNDSTKKKRSRQQMLGIMAIALVSLAGSYLLFYFAKTGISWGTTNNGAFVDPPVTIAELGWQVEGAEIERVWWLWVVSADCLDECQAMIKNLRAMQILLNREADRVRRGLSTTTGSAPEYAWLVQYPKLQQIYWQPDSPLGAQIREGVYIVDPLGNLVFQYPVTINPKLIQADLKKLLKVSQIG
jgi:cytochrome oxidase Cu insertion factor (SCO1/SenC/PrrC family)